MLPKLSEDAFQSQVIQLARMAGWKVAHFRKLRKQDGQWRTPVQADGKGFLDLVMVKLSGRRRVIYCELKSEAGQVEPDQTAWHEALRAAGAEVHVWRPSMWDEIQATLTA